MAEDLKKKQVELNEEQLDEVSGGNHNRPHHHYPRK